MTRLLGAVFPPPCGALRQRAGRVAEGRVIGSEAGLLMAGSSSGVEKIAWAGRLVGVQPRIRLLRSFDERQHSYQGYVLRVNGTCGTETGEVLVAVGQGSHAKYRFRAGMELSGQSVLVDDPRVEAAAFYKTSGLKVLKNAEGEPPAGLPFLGVPPDLPTYRARGHRRLDARTYEAKCAACIWGCRMPVEMIVDHWNPSQKEYRFETFCYGPKSCPLYRAGPTRKAPGRKGMSYTEEDWVDEDATSHRGPDD
jgi:hypothetical protein